MGTAKVKSYKDLVKAKAERAAKETAKETKKAKEAVRRAIREANNAEKEAKKAAGKVEEAITGKRRGRKRKRPAAEDAPEPKAKVARMSEASEQEVVPVTWSKAHDGPVPVVWTSEVQVASVARMI